MKDIRFGSFDSNMSEKQSISVGQARKAIIYTIGSAFLAACGAKAIDSFISPENTSSSPTKPSSTEVVKATEIPLPKVEQVYENEVQVILDICANCGELGITLDTIQGGYFGSGDFLFYSKDKNNFDYFWLVQGKNIQQLDFGIVDTSETDKKFILFQKQQLPNGAIVDGQLVSKTFFEWSSNVVDPNGNNIITYNHDGTPNTAQDYALPSESGLKVLFKTTNFEIPAESQLAYEVAKVTTVEAKYGGVAVSVDLIIDKTAMDAKVKSGGKEISLDDITLNSDFKNKYGEKSDEALAHAVLYSQWRAWQENTTDDVKAERINVSFDKWTGMVKTAQETNLQEDWDKVIFQASANDLTTEKYDPKYVDFKPGGKIKIVYTNAPFANIGVEIERISNSVKLGTGKDNEGELALFLGNFPRSGLNQPNGTVAMVSRALRRLFLASQGSNIQGQDWKDFVSSPDNDSLTIYYILANQDKLDTSLDIITK